MLKSYSPAEIPRDFLFDKCRIMRCFPVEKEGVQRYNVIIKFKERVGDMEERYAEKLEYLKQAIENSNYMVCLTGIGVSEDCGCINFRNQKDAVNTEIAYGYSPEEMLNPTFFNTRTEQFYDFYKNHMLRNLGEIKEGLFKLRRMEENGKLKCVITRDLFSIPRRAGCQNVYEIHGSVYENFCPHCGRKYSIEYIQDSKGVPKCESCGSVVRPGVYMVGEMVDNQMISRAADEVQKADTLLILGCDLKAPLPETFLKYFEGEHLILVNQEEHFADEMADLVIHGKPVDILKDLGI